MDFVALFALLALPLTGVVKFQDALKGFSDQSIILIALMFIIGESLERTGVSSKVGVWIVKMAGDNPKKLMVFLMLAVGIIGSVMSSTGIVALFIPVAVNICHKVKMSSSKIMMPLAIAGGVSGMMTLVATPPNMIASSALEKEGFAALNFFDFTPIGLTILIVSIVYMFFARRFLKGGNFADEEVAGFNYDDCVERYELSKKVAILKVPPASNVCGKKIKDLDTRKNFGANIICIERRRGINRELLSPYAEMELRPNDVLLVDFAKSREELFENLVARMSEQCKLEEQTDTKDYFNNFDHEHGFVEVLIPHTSQLVGSTLAEKDFRGTYGMSVVGIIHSGKAYTENLGFRKLEVGDSMLLSGPWSVVRNLDKHKRDMVLLTLPEESKNAVAAPGRAPMALLSVLIMVGLMISGVVPNALAALIGAVLLILSRCIDMDGVYRCINWSTLLLIVGMYPFATAIQEAGGIDLAVETATNIVGNASPYVWMAAIGILVMITGLFISNTVVAIILAPVAVEIAAKLQVSPVPFAMMVAIICSASFITPVSTPVNTLVMGPGGYKFFDFVKLGLPLALIVCAISVFLIPFFFPF